MDEELELNQNHIFEQLQDFLSNFSGELNILEDQIDVNVQLEYFKRTSELKSNNNIDELLLQAPMLSSDEEIDRKRELLCRLASVEDVRAYRCIESYLEETRDTPIFTWCRLALEESKMLLHTKLLDQKQLFISTGLGGRKNKLRYFIVLLTENLQPISEFQKSIVTKEFNYIFKRHKAEVEEISFNEQYATMMVLIPVNILLTDLFAKAIEECNQFGNFLKKDCIITNVRPLSVDDITKIINNPESANSID